MVSDDTNREGQLERLREQSDEHVIRGTPTEMV